MPRESQTNSPYTNTEGSYREPQTSYSDSSSQHLPQRIDWKGRFVKLDKPKSRQNQKIMRVVGCILLALAVVLAAATIACFFTFVATPAVGFAVFGILAASTITSLALGIIFLAKPYWNDPEYRRKQGKRAESDILTHELSYDTIRKKYGSKIDKYKLFKKKDLRNFFRDEIRRSNCQTLDNIINRYERQLRSLFGTTDLSNHKLQEFFSKIVGEQIAKKDIFSLLRDYPLNRVNWMEKLEEDKKELLAQKTACNIRRSDCQTVRDIQDRYGELLRSLYGTHYPNPVQACISQIVGEQIEKADVFSFLHQNPLNEMYWLEYLKEDQKEALKQKITAEMEKGDLGTDTPNYRNLNEMAKKLGINSNDFGKRCFNNQVDKVIAGTLTYVKFLEDNEDDHFFLIDEVSKNLIKPIFLKYAAEQGMECNEVMKRKESRAFNISPNDLKKDIFEPPFRKLESGSINWDTFYSKNSDIIRDPSLVDVEVKRVMKQRFLQRPILVILQDKDLHAPLGIEQSDLLDVFEAEKAKANLGLKTEDYKNLRLAAQQLDRDLDFFARFCFNDQVDKVITGTLTYADFLRYNGDNHFRLIAEDKKVEMRKRFFKYAEEKNMGCNEVLLRNERKPLDILPAALKAYVFDSQFEKLEDGSVIWDAFYGKNSEVLKNPSLVLNHINDEQKRVMKERFLQRPIIVILQDKDLHAFLGINREDLLGVFEAEKAKANLGLKTEDYTNLRLAAQQLEMDLEAFERECFNDQVDKVIAGTLSYANFLTNNGDDHFRLVEEDKQLRMKQRFLEYAKTSVMECNDVLRRKEYRTFNVQSWDLVKHILDPQIEKLRNQVLCWDAFYSKNSDALTHFIKNQIDKEKKEIMKQRFLERPVHAVLTAGIDLRMFLDIEQADLLDVFEAEMARVDLGLKTESYRNLRAIAPQVMDLNTFDRRCFNDQVDKVIAGTLSYANFLTNNGDDHFHLTDDDKKVLMRRPFYEFATQQNMGCNDVRNRKEFEALTIPPTALKTYIFEPQIEKLRCKTLQWDTFYSKNSSVIRDPRLIGKLNEENLKVMREGYLEKPILAVLRDDHSLHVSLGIFLSELQEAFRKEAHQLSLQQIVNTYGDIFKTRDGWHDLPFINEKIRSYFVDQDFEQFLVSEGQLERQLIECGLLTQRNILKFRDLRKTFDRAKIQRDQNLDTFERERIQKTSEIEASFKEQIERLPQPEVERENLKKVKTDLGNLQQEQKKIEALESNIRKKQTEFEQNEQKIRELEAKDFSDVPADGKMKGGMGWGRAREKEKCERELSEARKKSNYLRSEIQALQSEKEKESPKLPGITSDIARLQEEKQRLETSISRQEAMYKEQLSALQQRKRASMTEVSRLIEGQKHNANEAFRREIERLRSQSGFQRQ